MAQPDLAHDSPATPAPKLARPRIYYGYWLISAAFVAQFVSVGATNYVIGAFLKPMTTDLDWSRSEFTLARTVGQFVMAFTGFFIGARVDRHGGRQLMLIGVVILAGSLFALSYTQALWQFVVLNGLALTMGAAMIGNLVVNVTLSKWFVEKRGLAVGLASMGVSFAGVALTPAMTAVIDEWGWRAAWRVLGIGSALLIVPVSFVMRRAPEDHGLHPDGRSAEQVAAGMGAKASADFASSVTRAAALRTPAFYLLVIAFGMFGVTIGVMLLQTIPFMTDAGYSRGTASLMITLASIPALVSKPFWGWAIDKTDAKRLASASAFLTGLSLVVITLSVHFTADWFVYFGFFLLGCGWGGMIPLQEVIWATFFGRRYLGAVRSAGLPFSLVLGAGAPLIVSLYFDRVGNYDGALYTVAALNVLSALLLLFIPKPGRGGNPPDSLATAPATS
jgi:OFA family oxalate/formate antiporter-like MFS transporter